MYFVCCLLCFVLLLLGGCGGVDLRTVVSRANTGVTFCLSPTLGLAVSDTCLLYLPTLYFFYDSHGTCGEYPQLGSLCCFSRRTAMTALWKAFRLERGKHGDSSSSPSSAAPTPLHPPSLLVGPVSVYCDWAR